MLATGRYVLFVLLSLAFVASCTNANKVNRIQRTKAKKDASADGSGSSTNLPKTGAANLTVNFSNEKFSSLNMSALSYRFLYLGVSMQGPIVFQGSLASLSLANLPTNVADDVRLEVYENNQFQMIGRAPKVTLKAGNNQVTITDFTSENVEINGAWDGKSFQGNAAWNIEGN